MARLLRASCLLSLLLAGFVPPGRGQEKSKVSKPPGRKTPPCDPRSLRPSLKSRPACFSGQNKPRRTVFSEFIRSPLSFRGSLATSSYLGPTVPFSEFWRRLRHQESVAGGHPENLLRVGSGLTASSLTLEAEICVTGRVLTWRHIPFWASVSPSAGRREKRMVGRLWNTLVALPIHSPLASHAANTVAREANPDQAETSGAPSMLVQL